MKSVAPSVPGSSSQFGNSLGGAATTIHYPPPFPTQDIKLQLAGLRLAGLSNSGPTFGGSESPGLTQPTGTNQYTSSLSRHPAGSIPERGQISSVANENKYLPPGTNSIKQQSTQYPGLTAQNSRLSTNDHTKSNIAYGGTESERVTGHIGAYQYSPSLTNFAHRNQISGDSSANKYLSPGIDSVKQNGSPGASGNPEGSIVKGESGSRVIAGPNNQYLSSSTGYSTVSDSDSPYRGQYSSSSSTESSAGTAGLYRNKVDVTGSRDSKAFGGGM